MRNDDLPSPGLFNHSMGLRQKATQAISQLQVTASLYPNGKAPDAGKASAFFLACKAACDAIADTVAPTLTARAISAASPNVITLTASETLDATIVPANTAFTLASPARTVTSVKVSGNKVTLTVDTPYAAGDTAPTVAYTVPTANGLRDLGGNFMAASAATAITRVA